MAPLIFDRQQQLFVYKKSSRNHQEIINYIRTWPFVSLSLPGPRWTSSANRIDARRHEMQPPNDSIDEETNSLRIIVYTRGNTK